jgi:hypothetical protein
MPQVTPPSLFCDGYFRDRVSQTVCPGWLWTAILLISASWVVRITGMSHQHPAHTEVLRTEKIWYMQPTLKKFRSVGGVFQVTKHLPSKCTALSWNLSTAKKKKKRKFRRKNHTYLERWRENLARCLKIVIFVSRVCGSSLFYSWKFSKFVIWKWSWKQSQWARQKEMCSSTCMSKVLLMTSYVTNEHLYVCIFRSKLSRGSS